MPNSVISRLQALNPDLDGIDFMQVTVLELLGKGWTEDECVMLLRNTEEVSPHLDEHTAIKRMMLVKDIVTSRLGTK